MKNYVFDNGLTVRQLKEILSTWSEVDMYGEECEVWFSTGDCLSSQVNTIYPLNYRQREGIEWADIILGREKL